MILNCPPIVVIHLKRAVDRINMIVMMQKLLGRGLVLHDAVDGCGYSYESNSIACVLSHFSVWRYMLEKNIDYLCILEDDAIIVDKIEAVEVPDDFEILYLTERMTHTGNFKAAIGGGTEGYILSRGGAEKLIKIFSTPIIPIDHVIDAHIKDFIETGEPYHFQGPGLDQFCSRNFPDLRLNGYCSLKIYVKHDFANGTIINCYDH